jgi:hypothetical protein
MNQFYAGPQFSPEEIAEWERAREASRARRFAEIAKLVDECRRHLESSDLLAPRPTLAEALMMASMVLELERRPG